MRLSFHRILLALLVIVAVSSVLVAHERREVDDYQLVFGWRNEPALVGYPNGPELYIRVNGAEVNPVANLDVALQVEVTTGPASKTLALRRSFSDPTHFIADLIPTRAGDYSFRVFGTIGDLEIDEVFDSADGSFSSVEPAGDVTFPDELPSIVQLLERIAQLEARIAELEAGE